MGQFDPNTREVNLFTKQFLEAAKLQGTSTHVKLISSATHDLYKDPTYEYQDWKDLDVILNERPNRYMLDTYGWYNEDEEFVPILMYVAKHGPQGELIKPLTGSLVLLPYELVEDENMERKYTITNSVLTNPGAWMWVCKLAPYRYEKEEEPDSEAEVDPNYDFLNVLK